MALYLVRSRYSPTAFQGMLAEILCGMNEVYDRAKFHK
jgi:hypothetical protein